MIRFRHGAATAVGRVRRVNEDSFLVIPPLYAVADGMGGHGSGDRASTLAVQVLSGYAELRPLFAEAVLSGIEEANRVILNDGEAPREGGHRMGTTLTGLAGLETQGGDHLMIFNVGDSRVYRLADGKLEQLTVDHSEVQELVLAGVITREQARTHPRRNIVTRALGSEQPLRTDHWLRPVISGDRYLICSDGLFTELPDDAIASLLATGAPQQTAEALVLAAVAAGGHDNVTVLVVDIESDEASADDATRPREILGREQHADTIDWRDERDGPPVRRDRPDGDGPARDTARDNGHQDPWIDSGLSGLGVIGADDRG